MLVDSGASSCNDYNFGSVLTNLKAAGYRPEQVGAILLTHLHADHVCGISNNGVANFPNATIYISQPEMDFWMNPKSVESLPQQRRASFTNTVDKIKNAIAPYQSKNQLKPSKLATRFRVSM